MSDNVPTSLWAEILVNLPVKSLVQCTSVCKLWHSLITTSSFVDTHLSSSLHRRHHSPLLLLTPSPADENDHRFFATFQTDPLEPTKNFNRPFPACTVDHKDSYWFLRVVGSVHGLVCLSDDARIYGSNTNVIILWNPLIHKSLQLPRSQLTFATAGPFKVLVGFGFDSRNNDYKVVRIWYQMKRDEIKDLLPLLAEVYSISEGFWRTVNADYVQYCIWEGCQCFIHGAVHWVAYDKNSGLDGKGFKNVILLFDVGTEVFSTMMLPESFEYLDPLLLSVAVIGGLLTVFEGWTTIWVQSKFLD